MANKIVPLATYQIGSNVLSSPEVHYFGEDQLHYLEAQSGSGEKQGGTEIQTVDGKTIAKVYETPSQVAAMRDRDVNDIITGSQHIRAGLTAAGSAQGAGVALTTYISEITAITATSAEAADLDAATVGKVRVIINNDVAGSDDLELFPASTENFDSEAADAIYPGSVPGPGQRLTLVCFTAGTWTTVTDNG